MFTNETGIFNGSVELSYRRYKTYNYLNCHKKLQQPKQYPDFPAKIALYRGAMCPLINSNLKPDTAHQSEKPRCRQPFRSNGYPWSLSQSKARNTNITY